MRLWCNLMNLWCVFMVIFLAVILLGCHPEARNGGNPRRAPNDYGQWWTSFKKAPERPTESLHEGMALGHPARDKRSERSAEGR